MVKIEDYVRGLHIPQEQQKKAIDKLHEMGFQRYDRYYWQEIENIVASVVDEKTTH